MTGSTRGRRLVAAFGLFAVAVALVACGSPRELVGYQISPQPVVDATELPDLANGGEPFRLIAPEGGLLVVYFGFTECPDYCPITMTSVSGALDQLGDDADRVGVAMVSLDPERDAEVLAEYIQSFVPDAHALLTDDQQVLRDVAFSFGAEFRVTERGGGVVTVDHTTHLYAVDDEGNLAITWIYGVSSSDIADDLRQLLDGDG